MRRHQTVTRDLNGGLKFFALILLFLSLPRTAYPQVKSVSVLVGVGSANNKIVAQAPSFNSAAAYLDRRDLKPKSMTASLLIDFSPFKSKNLLFQSGIHYLAYSNGDPFTQDRSVDDLNITRSVFYTQDYSWLGIPVDMKYEFGNGRLRPFVVAGMSANLPLASGSLKEHVRVNDANGNLISFTQQSISSNERLQLWANTGVGVEFGLARLPKIGFQLQLQAAQQLTSIDTNVVKEKLCWFNAAFGIRYRLKTTVD